ncbi:MAG: archaeosortase/exosortase family protein [Caldisericia bacterium]|nr:archaeosortase/exosortase family protein [Caldisericia bacterium]
MKTKKALRFILVFVASALILQWVLHQPIIVEPFTYFTTQCTYLLLRLFGYPVTMNYFHIIGAIDMEIIYECTGVYVIIILTSGFLASWHPWEEKLLAIAGGFGVVFVTNQVRLLSIFMISSTWPDAFEFLHSYFWQFFLIFIVCLVYYLWMQKMDMKYATTHEK